MSEIKFFDGGMGSILIDKYPQRTEPAELWSLLYPEAIAEIHSAYIKAGAELIKTNTFGVNPLKYPNYEALVTAAVDIAKKAAAGTEVKIMLDIGPTGRLLRPFGDMDFDTAAEAFGKVARLGEALGCDGVLIETMGDMGELKAAVVGVKESCSLPIFATCTFGNDGKMMTGGSPEAAAVMLEGLGVAAVGANCSTGPAAMADIIRRMRAVTSLPLIANPNAGMPRISDGRTVYELSADSFAEEMKPVAEAGAEYIGGCCGTTPEHIRAIKIAAFEQNPCHRSNNNAVYVSSYTTATAIGTVPVIIGERINPTGKKVLKEALRAHNMSYIEELAIAQQSAGAHILDVNTGLPEIDEVQTLCDAVEAVQSVSDLPLQIDTSDPAAMEKAVRLYRGKPLINSVCGKADSMDSIFPIVKKYGGAVICLTLDEAGVPDSVEGRVKIADRIIARAAEYGIDKSSLIFDPLALTVSGDSASGKVTLDTITALKEKHGVKCSLGISNISFGMPDREGLNAAFFTLALSKGLDAGIVNPSSPSLMQAYLSYRLLTGADDGCSSYIAYHSGSDSAAEDTLQSAIINGLSEKALSHVNGMLKGTPPRDIIDKEIVPALTECGRLYECGKMFLPQLLRSAEAAKAVTELVSSHIPKGDVTGKRVIMATVKGDIHDIGKNIASTVLSSYGYEVYDLGRDVSSEAVLESIERVHPMAVGLSALMTTTLPAMRETVKAIKAKYPSLTVMVGGAVLTEEYAADMGADVCCTDAMSNVKYLESLS